MINAADVALYAFLIYAIGVMAVFTALKVALTFGWLNR